MLSSEAKRHLDQFSPLQSLSFVVFVHADSVLNEARAISDFEQRAKKIKSMYSSAKQPVLSILNEYENINVIDILDGTPNMIVSGPADAWRRMFLERRDMRTNPVYEFIPGSDGWASTP